MDFDFKQGLRRLADRCPELKNEHRLAALLSKEGGSVDRIVLVFVQELLLKPHLTVTVAGCFRPILSDVVSDWVHGFDRSAFDLKNHEYVSMALSRILELAPFLLSPILQYFAYAPPPFERLYHGKNVENGPSLLEVIRASYRFLQMEPRNFRELWDWSPFLNLLQWTGSGLGSSGIVPDVRWCAVQVLSLVFRMSDAASRNLSCLISNLSEEDAFECLIRWEEFSQEIAIEKVGMFAGCEDWPVADGSMEGSTAMDYKSVVKWKQQQNGKVSHVSICGVELPIRGDFSASQRRTQSSFVVTPSVKSQMQSVALALSQRQPVLLEGPLGSGKSSLIRELARLTGNSDVLFIHLDEQMDMKTLLGNYVCTEIPGEFKWQPGTLAQAVEKGLWVVFEDVYKARSDLFSSLVSLLEDRRLQIPGRGETIYATENFRLFATTSHMKFGSMSKSDEGFSYLWRKVIIDAPSDEELFVIIKERFPGLRSLATKLIGTLNLVKDIASQASASVNSSGELFIHIGRHFSTRDLLKLCKRVSEVHVESAESLSPTIRDQIYMEAVDCFVASMSKPADRQLVMRAIAELWDIPLERVELYNSFFKPAVQELPFGLQIGRVILPFQRQQQHHVRQKGSYNFVFADTGHTMRMQERIARCVEQNEPVLLVGETGTGKTTLVQRLAWQMSTQLTVVNLSTQSDAADLLGGFKPVEAQNVCLPLVETFNQLFAATFSLQRNKEFFATIQQYVEKKKWAQLLKAFRIALGKVGDLNKPNSPKRQKPVSQNILDRWCAFSVEVNKTQKQVDASKSAFAFSFFEGALVKALKNGTWLLLDEINLAPVEILERLNGVFDAEDGSVCLTERGDLEVIQRHSNFRIFACMNPALDVGKRELPVLLRNRLTEIYVDEMDFREDLEKLVFKYLEGAMPSPPVEDVVDFFLKVREEAEKRLLDGAGHKPRYSLRSLSRALEYTRIALPTYGFQRALYDGVSMSFLTLLDQTSSPVMEQLIQRILLKQTGKTTKLLIRAPPQPSPDHVLFEQFWIQRGTEKQSNSDRDFVDRYVVTKTIREHLKNLARAVFIRKYPVLLQGPTSSGKTSLVRYLAAVTGHKFVRINNHEHTDLQEYLGSYVSDHTGKLVFQEGLLVEAVRKGYWVVLDELNLAPSDVLEALNRLLDDNRELFVPELQVTVKPHPQFMLFATQNPPGVYGGRKVLSRAFRNRFIELHVDDIPSNELVTILEKRCEVPLSYATKMVEVMKDLQRHRMGSNVFAGKHGYITPRDLFRWADRHRKNGITYDDLAWCGYVLLAERIREEKEKVVVQTALEKNLKVQLNPEKFLQLPMSTLQQGLQNTDSTAELGRIVWMKSMRRLFYLAEQCCEHNEPLLLVGETGCGKTTVCQLLALSMGQKLHILNCHQHTETSDFLGGFRPVRGRDNIALKFQELVSNLNALGCFSNALSSRMEDSAATLESVSLVLKSKGACTGTGVATMVELTLKKMQILHKEWQSLFVWHDGPLVTAMKNGDLFLIDEINLADDSVLERLNSVLESKGSLVLAEKGGNEVDEIVAHPKFRIMATMNPGGDFGKKELSPALRNRFTEVWVPPISDLDDLRSIIFERLIGAFECLVEPLIQFWKWIQQRQETGRLLSVRDLLSWINYINTCASEIGIYAAFVHGCFLVLLDGLGLGSGLLSVSTEDIRAKCVDSLLKLVPESYKGEAEEACGLHSVSSMETDNIPANTFGIHPFYISRGCSTTENAKFEFRAPTTSRNVMRILRAMQLRKPVLLEGSPGVGKTSLVSALAAASGHTLVRINLSEQTDILDLFGSDLPVEGGKAGEFQWSDGVFLQALKAGNWVLLDELNLASQSVLEGLNSCLDHRSEVFIPELGLVFKCPPTFRLFACQNPLHEGGGRKGLPKSFLNRFTRVYAEPLSSADYLFIARALHPRMPEDTLSKMIEFNSRLHEEITVKHSYGHSGAPWEFNLRDILRWCILMEETHTSLRSNSDLLAHFVNIVYIQRLRTHEDRAAASELFKRIFGSLPSRCYYPDVSLSANNLTIGLAKLKRPKNSVALEEYSKHLDLLPGSGYILEFIMHCIKNRWMCMLVGPLKSGKTSAIRMLAHLTGNTLYEYNLSGSTDTTELLGCFEQHDTTRYLREAYTAAECSTQSLCGFCLSQTVVNLSAERRVSIVKNVIASWSTLKKSRNIPVDQGVIVGLLNQLLEQLEAACGLMQFQGTERDFGLGVLRQLVVALSVERKENVGRFEWIDGDLLRAVERGDWILLENANLCNPTVLDRLNSLLEPGGSLMVNERGLVNGQPMLLRAHPNFRLFFTLNPANGEVSRAMRNRGVEIFMSTSVEEEIVLSDASCLIKSFGVPGLPLIEEMAKVHVEVRSCNPSSISLRELQQWLNLLKVLLERGGSFHWSMQYSWEQSYLACINTEQHSSAINIFRNRLSSLELTYTTSFYVPTGWPFPLRLHEYSSRSQEYTVKRDCGYVSYLLSNLVAYEIAAQARTVPSTELLKWLHNMKSLTPEIPQKLLKYMLYPEKSIEIPEINIDTAEIDKKLLYAIAWALEQAPIFEIDRRVQWIRHFSMENLQKKAPKSIRGFLSVLTLEKQHPVSGALSDAWDHFKQVTNLSGIDSVSENTIFDIESGLAECGDEAQAILRRLIVLLNMRNMLRMCLLQWQTEDEYLNNQSQHGSPMSPIMLSYWHHTQPAGKITNVCGRTFIWLYPLLLFLRKLANEYMLQPQNFLTCEESFELMIELHAAFWKAIQEINAEIDYIQHIWLRLKRCVLELVNKAKLQHASGDILQLMDAALSTGISPSLKPYFWKFSGHPQLPQTQEFINFESKLLQACKREIYSGELWLLLLEASCMVSCMGRLRETSDIQAAEKMIEVVLRRLESEKITNTENILLAKVNVPHSPTPRSFCTYGCGKIKSFFMELLHVPSGRDFWEKTNSLFRHLSLLLDGALLSYLLPSVAEFTFDNDPRALVKKIKLHWKTLHHTLCFGLKTLSRTPGDYVPQQHLIWIMDVDSLSSSAECIRDYVHEFAFRWHSALWQNAGACERFQASETVLFWTLVTGSVQAKEYNVKTHQLGIALDTLWYSAKEYSREPLMSDLCSLSAFLQQIVYSHKKLFSRIDVISSTLSSLHAHLEENTLDERKVEDLRTMLHQIQHQEIGNILNDLILPYIGQLYLTPWNQLGYHDALAKLGQVWLLAGRIRVELLLIGYGIDPMAKYIYRHRHLVEKLEDISIEIKVREESNRFVKGGGTGTDLKMLITKQDSVKEDLQKLDSKLVPRPNPPLFRDFVNEALQFMLSYANPTRLSTIVKALTTANDSSMVVEEVNMWQESATNFIQQLTSRFSSYRDVIQPLQLGVYEIKYGLSLVTGAYESSRVCEKGGQVELYMKFIRSLMSFPSVSHDDSLYELTDNRMETLIERSLSFNSCIVDSKATELRLKVSVLLIAFLRFTHGYLHSRHVTASSLKLVHGLLHSIVNVWKQVRSLMKLREEENAQQFRISTLDKKDEEEEEASFKELFPSHWSLQEDNAASDGYEVERLVSNDTSKETQLSNAGLTVLQEEIMKNVASLHRRIFCANKSSEQVTDQDRIHAFTLSYGTSQAIFEGVTQNMPKSVDNVLFPAHLFKLSLEQLNLTSGDATTINIYKDSSPSELSRMLEPLAALVTRIEILLEEYPEHPVLLQVMQFVNTLLSISSSSPIMKALQGLEIVLSKAQLWEDNAPKYLSLTEELAQVSKLVLRWRKMELESWPVLFQDVYQQHEANANKLWFPFYDLLHSGPGLEFDGIVESSEELLLSSPIGEFQSRLKLIEALYMEFDLCSRLSPSVNSEGLSSILYNMFQYYSRFLPKVQETLNSGKEPLEKELTDFIRLSKWEDHNFYSVKTTAERTHRKIHKILRKYNEFLKRPVMDVFKTKRENPASDDKEGINKDIPLGCLPKKWSDLFSTNMEGSTVEKKLTSTASKMVTLLSSNIFGEQASEVRQAGAATLEDLATSIITRGNELRQENISRALKKKALNDLRKALKGIGLSHYKSDIPKDMRTTKSWFQLPATELHNLQTSEHKTEMEYTLPIWNRAKEYYVDNIALLQEMYKSSLDYHKDLSLAEVELFTRYMEYTLYLQQKQRRKIKEFTGRLSHVIMIAKQLQELGIEDNALPLQGSTRKTLWAQKNLLDGLCNLCLEVELFFCTVAKAGDACKSEALDLARCLKPEFDRLQACKNMLDKLLVPCGVVDQAQQNIPLLITSEMYEIAKKNFSVIQEVDHSVRNILTEYSQSDGAGKIMLESIRELLHKGVEMSNVNENIPSDQSFAPHYEEIITQIRLAGQRLQKLSDRISEVPQSETTIPNVESFIEETMEALRFDRISISFMDCLHYVVKAIDNGNTEAGVSLVKFSKVLHPLLEMLVAAGLHVLRDYICMHKAIAKLGYIVSSVLNQLYVEGFCGAREEEKSEGSKFEEAEGTGMGEGEGSKDVSEQIEDEEQLLGNSEHAPPEDTKKQQTDKGIEMEQDFQGDMFDVSEDESDEEDTEDNQDKDTEDKLESRMGQQEENEEIVDEKMWDEEDDKMDDKGSEKVEKGQALPNAGFDDLELRAMDEEETPEEETQAEKKKPEEQKRRDQIDTNENDENGEDNRDAEDNRKENAFEDSTGLKPELMDDKQDTDNKEGEEEPVNEENVDEQQAGVDEMETDAVEDSLPEDMKLDKEEHEGELDEENKETEQGEAGEVHEQTTERDYDEEKGSETEEAKTETEEKNISNINSQDGENIQANLDEVELQEQQHNTQNQNATYGVAAKSQGNPLTAEDHHGSEEHEASGANNEQNEQQQSTAGSSGDSYATSSLPSTEQRNERLDANPYRSLGDALKKWQRVHMIEDGHENPAETATMETEQQVDDGDQTYKFVSNGEETNEQAVGAATEEQMELCDELNKLTHDEKDDDIMEEDTVETPFQDIPKEINTPLQEKLVDEQKQISSKKASNDKPEAVEAAMRTDMEDGAREGSYVSYGRMDSQQSRRNNDENITRKELECEIRAGVNKDMESAKRIWQKYEQLTARLSQDLAEQLRLILEPTLASRLQGDYKSGKRLNMKKIIPFVASEFRKDKIWLRRTKPNKRQYQVVIALDDSRSMSESHCGHVALEALITICRSMMQLEVGQMAVASFGKKGNVRLLHDLEQPFSTEAAVKIISEFSFSQDNTISDEPMVDLLEYLTRFLNVVATKYAPSGSRDLQQLVLIIADGRFHEKESLRRCVRDALSRKQLLAFLVLDNPQESLLDMQSVAFANGTPSFSKYLDTFPFPYYVLLKDIEALPRILADLLRQWFELMQSTSSF